jgi:hypothetical protein
MPSPSFNPFAAPFAPAPAKRLEDFTVGETVRLVSAPSMSAKVGATGKIVSKNHSFKWLEIKWDRNDLRGAQSDGMYEPHLFETLPAGDYILIVKNSNGKYEPAAYPRVYATEAQAMAVGDSMAEKHGGTFVVFKAVAAVIAPPPVVRKNTVQKFS